MASLKNLPPCPDNLKPMLHFLKAAVEHDNRDPVVAYWLRFYAVQLGIRIDSKSKPGKTFISGVMDALENTKKSLKTNEAVTTDIVAQAHIENYALKLFSWADAEDRASHFDKNVVKAFYTAGLLFDTLAIWGELPDEIKHQQKYSKWKAAYLHTCLKNGETPIPGPAGGEAGGDDDLQLTIGQNNDASNSNTTSAYIPPSTHDTGNTSAYDQLFNALPSVPKLPQQPPNTLPVAPPRGGQPTSAKQNPSPSQPSSAKPSPSTEQHSSGSVLVGVTGVTLTSEDIAKAQKYCKYAGSALQFDDLATATDLLEKTLRLLKTGRED